MIHRLNAKSWLFTLISNANTASVSIYTPSIAIELASSPVSHVTAYNDVDCNEFFRIGPVISKVAPALVAGYLSNPVNQNKVCLSFTRY